MNSKNIQGVNFFFVLLYILSLFKTLLKKILILMNLPHGKFKFNAILKS